SRHHLHAKQAAAALQAGKHVLVEKPLALSRGELAQLLGAVEALAGSGPAPVLMVGFNRRFSPHLARMQELLQGRTGPLLIQYRVNAGPLPPGHWANGPEGGGRNLGEACHFYDLFTFLTGSRSTSVRASACRRAGCLPTEDFSAMITFDDGSVASLLYTSSGS